MITYLFSAATWCGEHRLKIIATFLFFIAGLCVKAQTQKPNFVFTANSTTTFGWKAMESGWGVNKITTDTGFAYQADTSQVMTVSRASDSIANMKATISTKMATASFTKAAMVALGMLSMTDAAATYYPLSSNPSNYLTSVPAQSFASLTGKPTTLSGYGIADATSNARSAVSLTTTGTSGAATYNSGTGVLNVPQYTYTPPSLSFNNSPSVTIQTVAAAANGTQVSATRNAVVNYSVTISTTVSLSGNSSGYVALEICPTNSSTAADWIEIGRAPSGQSGTLVIGLVLTQSGAGQLGGIVPIGYYRRIRSVSTTGSPVFQYNSGQEVLL